uniref:F-box domain-containing protein n=1 Tax=Oryza punctata TaxID=4537 RepID=A0A0E0M2I5_ORYPU
MVPEKAEPSKQQKFECFIDCLPKDLIEQIFLSLPVKTLLRCSGVCKQWRSIIRDPNFVTSHLQLAARCALLFFSRESVSSELYPSDAVLIDEAWSQSTWAVPVIGPDDFLCGSSNGLVCLYTQTTTIKIANLATGECLHIEKPVKNLAGDHSSFYSFGFHPVTKKYKVTHFLGDSREAHPHAKDSFNAIQVYTLGDEKWKDVGAPEALSLNCVKNSGVVNVDGTMYWLTEDQGASWKHAVISFDLSRESFGRIQLPTVVLEHFEFYGPREYWIKEIDGKVCIATSQTTQNQPRELIDEIQIWTLHIHLEQRWIQKYMIQSSPQCILGPNIFHGDKILSQQYGSILYSCELLGKNLEVKMSNADRLLDFTPRKPGNMQSYTFVKSLVRLDAYKKASIVRRPKRQEGWELKKWEAWESKRCMLEDSWKDVQQLEQDYLVTPKNFHTVTNWLLLRQPDDEALKCISMRIDQMLCCLSDRPNQHPRPLRRLNWLEQKQNLDDLKAHVNRLRDTVKEGGDLLRTITSYLRDQGMWIPTSDLFPFRNRRNPPAARGADAEAASGIVDAFEQTMASKKALAMQPSKKNCMTLSPQDIVELILVFTLLRCRGVCKQWDGIIQGPQFAMAHIKCAPRCPLFFFQRENLVHLLYPSEAILFDEAWSPSKWDIANLATGECMHLVKPVRNSKTDHFSYYSFGFLPVKKQYKVMHFLRDEHFHVGTSFSIIQRDVRTPQALSLSCVERSGVVNVDGAIEELFQWLQLPAVDPANYVLGDPDQWLITEIDGKTGKLHIWTIDSKIEQSWSQKYNIRFSMLDVPGPHWICGDKIILHDFNRNLYFYELMGKNSEIGSSNLVKQLRFSPRNNMQCFMLVKSLVRLDAFRKADVVRRPKRREGWKLKKWEVWMDRLYWLKNHCRKIHDMKHKIYENADKMGMEINLDLQQTPDLDSSLRPINWVEYRRM